MGNGASHHRADGYSRAPDNADEPAQEMSHVRRGAGPPRRHQQARDEASRRATARHQVASAAESRMKKKAPANVDVVKTKLNRNLDVLFPEAADPNRY